MSYQGNRFGVLGSKSSKPAPGTVVLTADRISHSLPDQSHPIELQDRSYTRTSARTTTSGIASSNRRRKTADGRCILQPQPSCSADDPLNWTERSRRVILIALSFYCMLAGIAATVFTPGFDVFAKGINVDLTPAVGTTWVYMVGLGVGCALVFPTAKVFGKRPLYLISAATFVLYTIWCALSSGIASFTTARLFQGLAASSMEVLAGVTIFEISFLHQHGLWFGTYALFMIGGMTLTPIVTGVILQYRKWHLCFWILSGFAGIVLILMTLLAPDTFVSEL